MYRNLANLFVKKTQISGNQKVWTTITLISTILKSTFFTLDFASNNNNNNNKEGLLLTRLIMESWDPQRRTPTPLHSTPPPQEVLEGPSYDGNCTKYVTNLGICTLMMKANCNYGKKTHFATVWGRPGCHGIHHSSKGKLDQKEK